MKGPTVYSPHPFSSLGAKMVQGQGPNSPLHYAYCLCSLQVYALENMYHNFLFHMGIRI